MRQLLHILPPETAHGLSLWGVRHGLAPKAATDAPALQTTLFGRTLANPIGLSAGADKQAAALKGWQRMGFGFVEAGTVTLHPRAGNPGKRLWRKGNGHLVNWLGLPGKGLEPFIKNLSAFNTNSARQTLMVGVSLASPDNSLDEFRQLAAATAPLADYLTLNASCPNIVHGDDSTARTVREQTKAVVAEAGGKPVLLKLGPTQSEAALKLMVETAMESGAKGFVLTNTVPPEKRNLLGELPFDWPQHDGHAVGGYSGPLLLATTLWMVKTTRAMVGGDVPIIGVGGIQSGADARAVMDASANAVQLYTGLVYRGSKLLTEIKQSLAG